MVDSVQCSSHMFILLTNNNKISGTCAVDVLQKHCPFREFLKDTMSSTQIFIVPVGSLGRSAHIARLPRSSEDRLCTMRAWSCHSLKWVYSMGGVGLILYLKKLFVIELAASVAGTNTVCILQS